MYDAIQWVELGLRMSMMVVKGDSITQAAGTQATAAFCVHLAVRRVHRKTWGVGGRGSGIVVVACFGTCNYTVESSRRSKLPGMNMLPPSDCHDHPIVLQLTTMYIPC